MNVYIAGPMTGIEEFNYPAFGRAAERFRGLGHTVTSPHEVAHDDNGIRGSIRHADYVRRDLRELLQCDAIALLPGWQASKGAKLEVQVATELGFTFYDAGTGLRVGEPRPATDDQAPAAGPEGRVIVDVLNMGMVQDIADALTTTLHFVPKGTKEHAKIVDTLERAKFQSEAAVERRGRVAREQREELEAHGLA